MAMAATLVLRTFIQRNHGRIEGTHGDMTQATLRINNAPRLCTFSFECATVLDTSVIVDELNTHEALGFFLRFEARNEGKAVLRHTKRHAAEGIRWWFPVLLSGEEEEHFRQYENWLRFATEHLLEIDLVIDMVRNLVSDDEARFRQRIVQELGTTVGNA